MLPVTSWPVRSEIHASLFPALRAHAQNVERRSWKRSRSTFASSSSKRIARAMHAARRSSRSAVASRFGSRHYERRAFVSRSALAQTAAIGWYLEVMR